VSDAAGPAVLDRAAVDATLRRLGLCGFAAMLSMRFCDALLPALAAEFHVTSGVASRTIAGFALAYGLLQLFYGPLGDRYGKLRVIALASLGCCAANLAAACAPGLDALVAARVAGGATAAGVIPLTMAWVGDHVPYAERQGRLAQLLGATVSGMVAGQWLGGVAAGTVGWRAGFGALSLLFLAAALMLWPRAAAAVHEAPAGSGLARLGRVLGTGWARVILALVALEGAFVFGAVSFVPHQLHLRHGLSMPNAGAVLALFGVGGLLYSRCARRLLARVGEAGLARIGALGLAAGFGLMAWLPAWSVALAACLLAGFGYYALHNTLQTQATQMAPVARGSAVALFACALFFGQSGGVAVSAWAVDRGLAPAVFAAAALALGALGLVAGLLLGRRGRTAEASP